MRIKASTLLAVLAFAAPAALAQTKGTEEKAKVETEKLWKIECAGVGG